jgi:hypothetical protein
LDLCSSTRALSKIIKFFLILLYFDNLLENICEFSGQNWCLFDPN